MKDTNPWDVHQARNQAMNSLADQDATDCLMGIHEAFRREGWLLQECRLWWRPGWSPSSHMTLVIDARWVGADSPKPPTISATIYDLHDRLVRVADISPFDAWDIEEEGFKTPKVIRYESTLHLVGHGPDTAPSRVVVSSGEADDEGYSGPVLNPASPTVSGDRRWTVTLNMGIDGASTARDAARSFWNDVDSRDASEFRLRIEDHLEGRIFYTDGSDLLEWDEMAIRYSDTLQAPMEIGFEIPGANDEQEPEYRDFSFVQADEEPGAPSAEVSPLPALSDREWKKVHKHPERHFGLSITIYGSVLQCLSPADILAQTGMAKPQNFNAYDDVAHLWGADSILDEFVEGDVFEAEIVVDGIFEYETVLGVCREVPTLRVESMRLFESGS